MNKCAIIVSGGVLYEELTLKTIRGEENPCVIGVDKGIEFLYDHDIEPSYIVGDFDSVKKEIADYYKYETDIPVREFNPVKDASDTEIAIRLGVALGSKRMIILGATGGRIDHLWANVQSLMIPLKAGVDAVILDPLNRIRLINEKTRLRKEEQYGPYFSVFPLGGPAYGFEIKGAKYPLEEHTLTATDSRCVSNEIKGDEAEIDFTSGIVILMETKDRQNSKY